MPRFQAISTPKQTRSGTTRNWHENFFLKNVKNSIKKAFFEPLQQPNSYQIIVLPFSYFASKYAEKTGCEKAALRLYSLIIFHFSTFILGQFRKIYSIFAYYNNAYPSCDTPCCINTIVNGRIEIGKMDFKTISLYLPALGLQTSPSIFIFKSGHLFQLSGRVKYLC